MQISGSPLQGSTNVIRIFGLRKTNIFSVAILDPVDTERKLNVHKTFRRRSVYVLCLRGSAKSAHFKLCNS